jgi:hypothetical protein
MQSKRLEFCVLPSTTEIMELMVLREFSFRSFKSKEEIFETALSVKL